MEQLASIPVGADVPGSPGPPGPHGLTVGRERDDARGHGW